MVSMNMVRGQGSLEFLSTYGFAFMLILIMVTGMHYFGILDPSILLPTYCSATGLIECEEFGLYATNMLGGYENAAWFEFIFSTSKNIDISQTRISRVRVDGASISGYDCGLDRNGSNYRIQCFNVSDDAFVNTKVDVEAGLSYYTPSANVPSSYTVNMLGEIQR